MKITQTALEGVCLLEPVAFYDNRGFFKELYSKIKFDKEDLNINFIQDCHSFNQLKNTFRGFHYQLSPYAQTMLVSVISGKILDIVIDIRKGSSTFGQHFSAELSDENHKQILIPKGFAHGFLTLCNNASVMYKTDGDYMPEFDRGIHYDSIQLDFDTSNLITSARDSSLPFFENADINFILNKNC